MSRYTQSITLAIPVQVSFATDGGEKRRTQGVRGGWAWAFSADWIRPKSPASVDGVTSGPWAA